MLSRRRVLAALPLLAAPVGLGCQAKGETELAPIAMTSPAPPLRGVDLSSTLQAESAGQKYKDKGKSAPVERLLAARGANLMRLRVWVDPSSGGYDLASAIELARRARSAGMGVLLDLHYSDTWADNAHQRTPAAWAGMDWHALAATVRTYTRDTVRAFAAQGIPLDMVQIGNEVTNGMLWPNGRVRYTQGDHWDGFVELLRAGLQGAAEGSSSELRTLVHVDNSGAGVDIYSFYDHLAAADIRFDVIALSYYPFWHGSLAALQTNLNDLANRYGKDVLVVETAYPWKLPPEGDEGQHLVTKVGQLPDGARFPPTPQGQAAFFDALRTVIARVPGGHGLGFLAWEPAWVPGVPWTFGGVNPYSNLTMFDWSGTGLPSLSTFGG
ncbi:arabinogalactan endo-beta-1,4-galactanase [Streptomyces sp. NPDC087263]|uniref:glycoside hydrolase family 53 protein n=1 Tax=Streptomyces sp. NPDC087263 TaxID=3365773 RepID=UPI0037F5EE17